VPVLHVAIPRALHEGAQAQALEAAEPHAEDEHLVGRAEAKAHVVHEPVPAGARRVDPVGAEIDEPHQASISFSRPGPRRPRAPSQTPSSTARASRPRPTSA